MRRAPQDESGEQIGRAMGLPHLKVSFLASAHKKAIVRDMVAAGATWEEVHARFPRAGRTIAWFSEALEQLSVARDGERANQSQRSDAVIEA